MLILLGQVMCDHSVMDKDLNMSKLLADHPAMEPFAAAKSTDVKIGYGVVEGHVKRIFDVICASVGLVILSPVFLLIAILIKLDSKGPVFFRHERVGWHGKLFKIHKFRSMYVEQSPSDLHITPANDPRITRAGRYLRKWKIDELPQLIDVLCGTMSLVGPRPSSIKYVSQYPENLKTIILSVRPGITDLASLCFRHEGVLLAQSDAHPENFFFEEVLPKKLSLQLKYVNNQSFLLDVKIIFSTVIAIFK